MTLPITTETVPLVTDVNGVIRVGKTRVTLDTVISAFLDGATAEESTYQYPSLDLADVYSVLSSYLRRRAIARRASRSVLRLAACRLKADTAQQADGADLVPDLPATFLARFPAFNIMDAIIC